MPLIIPKNRYGSNPTIIDPRSMPRERSELESKFLRLWHAIGGPPLEEEFEFAKPARKFRFDFVHLPSSVAIEIEGGTYKRGRHTRGEGFANDCAKYNLAATMGFTIFRLAGDMITTPHLQPIIEFCQKN